MAHLSALVPEIKEGLTDPEEKIGADIVERVRGRGGVEPILIRLWVHFLDWVDFLESDMVAMCICTYIDCNLILTQI